MFYLHLIRLLKFEIKLYKTSNQTWKLRWTLPMFNRSYTITKFEKNHCFILVAKKTVWLRCYQVAMWHVESCRGRGIIPQLIQFYVKNSLWWFNWRIYSCRLTCLFLFNLNLKNCFFFKAYYCMTWICYPHLYGKLGFNL